MGNDLSAKRFLISGRVQGVGFRAATGHAARRLGLAGQAVNLADGRVEVIAEGSAEALAKLHDWLQQGPPLARVDRLELASTEVTGRVGFALG